jgi:hypothetical protein
MAYKTTPRAINHRHYPFRFLGELTEPGGSIRVPTGDVLDYLKTIALAFGGGVVVGVGVQQILKWRRGG